MVAQLLQKKLKFLKDNIYKSLRARSNYDYKDLLKIKAALQRSFGTGQSARTLCNGRKM